VGIPKYYLSSIYNTQTCIINHRTQVLPRIGSTLFILFYMAWLFW